MIRTIFLALSMLATGQFAWAQSAPPAAGTGVRPPNSQLGPLAPAGAVVRSPEFLPDGRVTFRLAAPDALKVELHGNFPSGFQPSVLPMDKGADGVWEVTVGPLAPAFLFYGFLVDGVPALDPANPHTRRDGINVASTLLVPGDASAVESVNDVPHGTVALAWYPSPSLRLTRRATIYLPPG